MTPFPPLDITQEPNSMKRYRKLLIALAAIAVLYIARTTGLDAGMIDAVFDAAIEAIVDEAPGAAVEAPAGD